MDMAIKKKKKIYRPSAWESKCVMICRVCQDDHLKPRRLDQEADVRIRCVCCSWCCESGRCHTSAITRLFHNTRVAPHCCQHRDEEHHLWLLPFSYGFQICFIKVEIKALSNPLKSCVLYLVCCTCISRWFSFFFFNFSLCKTNHIIGFTCHYRSSINYNCSMFYGAVQWPLSKTLPCELFCMANYRKLIRKLKGRQSTGEHLWTDLWDLL